MPVFATIVENVPPETDLSILYPVTVPLGAVHARSICEDDAAAAVNPVGAAGGTVDVVVVVVVEFVVALAVEFVVALAVELVVALAVELVVALAVELVMEFVVEFVVAIWIIVGDLMKTKITAAIKIIESNAKIIFFILIYTFKCNKIFYCFVIQI